MPTSGQQRPATPLLDPIVLILFPWPHATLLTPSISIAQEQRRSALA
jgi:hypothetical protein